MSSQMTVEKWDVFEQELIGPSGGNPFKDVQLTAVFTRGHRSVPIRGFYDGDGVFRFRFMPDSLGEWRFRTESNAPELDGHEGSFECVAPRGNNRGPVRVNKFYHFAYAEGGFYSCIGTTSYAWIHQCEELAGRTIQSLASSPYNKLRMTVFPKSYIYNEHNEPESYPFPCLKQGGGSWDGHWDSKGGKIEWEFDWSRFDVRFFRTLETRLRQLLSLSIEVDLILFHPYDRWGFAQMSREVDTFYLEYLIARVGAFRHVWWSLANEWDYVYHKGIEDWEYIGRTIAELDPYHHLTGIHNAKKWFDPNRAWITHCSVQSRNPDIIRWRDEYRKPVVIDEMGYEGDLYIDWGFMSGIEMVHKFWEVTLCGGYPGHSEVFLEPNHVMWWNKGGELKGESTSRIAFLKGILERGPAVGIEPCPGMVSCDYCGKKTGAWVLAYTGRNQPGEARIKLQADTTYNLWHIDIWAMELTRAAEPVRARAGETIIALPGKPHTAFLLEASR